MDFEMQGRTYAMQSESFQLHFRAWKKQSNLYIKLDIYTSHQYLVNW